MGRYMVAADIGGTFTDIVVHDTETGRLDTTKVLTTVHDRTQGVVRGVRELVPDFREISFFVHGTTAAVNAFLERKGARAALITTRGFRDVYEIGRANRPEMYNLFWKKPSLLVRRRDIFEVTERLLYDGSVEIPLDEREVRELAGALQERGYEAVAVCLLHSYVNPEHERRVGDILRARLGDVPVALSHEVANEWREYERTSTTVLNAYIAPVMERYLRGLEREMEAGGFQGSIHIMQSNGGTMTSVVARRRPVQTLFSGPVGGTIGGMYVGKGLGAQNLICIDMGGTSFDVSLVVRGMPDVANEVYLDGLPVLTPVVNIHTIGSGGGSIARVEAGGLRVGPESAGADPGPACYGRGGKIATVTDANVVLGHVDPDYFLGGRMRLDQDAAFRVVSALGEALGLPPHEMAEGIISVANAKMVNAIRRKFPGN